MKFFLSDDQARVSSPSIFVSFPDGHTDKLVLGKHFFNNQDRMADDNDCRFFGHLEKEREACVAMTGCIGSEDVLFTIMSIHSPGSTHFLWTKEGHVEILDQADFVS